MCAPLPTAKWIPTASSLTLHLPSIAMCNSNRRSGILQRSSSSSPRVAMASRLIPTCPVRSHRSLRNSAADFSRHRTMRAMDSNLTRRWLTMHRRSRAKTFATANHSRSHSRSDPHQIHNAATNAKSRDRSKAPTARNEAKDRMSTTIMSTTRRILVSTNASKACTTHVSAHGSKIQTTFAMHALRRIHAANDNDKLSSLHNVLPSKKLPSLSSLPSRITITATQPLPRARPTPRGHSSLPRASTVSKSHPLQNAPCAK